MKAAFLFDLLERTARTFVQGFLAVVTLDAATEVNIEWKYKLLAGAIAGGYAVLTAFAAGNVGSRNDASFQ